MSEENVYKVCFIVRIGDSAGRSEFEESAQCEDDAVVCLSSVRAVR